MSDAIAPSPQALLAESDWVRALARRLVRDPHEAEDLAQEALTVAWERPPSDLSHARGWLARVLQNLVRQRHRRPSLEEAVDSDHEGPPSLSTVQVVERAELHHLVVRGVLDLDEPYRTTVLLRYFDGLGRREIAERQGVPLATVTSRLTRAHARLRERMPDTATDERRGMSILLPLLAPRERGALSTSAQVLMGAKLKIVAASVALIALAAVGAQVVDRGPSSPSPGDVDRAAVEPRALPALDSAAASIAGRSAAKPLAEGGTGGASLPAESTLPTVSGQVLLPDGSPAPNATVVLGGLGGLEFIETKKGPPEDLVHVATDADGRFSLPGPFASRELITAGAPGSAPSETLAIEVAGGASLADLVLQLRRGIRIHGEVHRKDGSLAPGRDVRLLRNSGRIEALGGRFMRMVTTDDAGHFDAPHLCPGSWGLLTYPDDDELAELGGSMPDHMAQATVELENGQEEFVALGARSAEAVIVSGTVIGEPAPGRGFMQWIRECDDPMGSQCTPELKAGGRYGVELPGPGAWYVRIFGSIGSGEFMVDVPAVAEYSLNFELPAAQISGHVLDAKGEPVKDAVCSHVLVQGIAHRGPLRLADDQSTTDDHGAFHFGGLTPGTYRIGVVHATLGSAATELIRIDGDTAVDGIELRLAGQGSIAGRVLGTGGTPAAHAPIWIHDAEGRIMNPITRILTNSEGRFRTQPLPVGDYSLFTQFGLLAGTLGGIRVVDDAPNEVELRLGAGAAIIVEALSKGERVRAHVRIHDQDGRLLNGLRSARDPWSWQRYPFDSHRKHAGPLPAGTYTVSAHVPGGGDASEVVTVVPGEERELRLTLR